MQGGAGSGKSIAIAQYLIITALSIPGHRIYAFRKVGTTVKNSIFATFKDLISDMGLMSLFSINQTERRFTCIETGVDIICGGMDDPEKIKSIKDPTIIWAEEATEFSRPDIDQLILRLRKEGIKNQLIVSYNPIDKRNWMYQALHVMQEWKGKELFIKSTYRDNPFLPQRYIDHLQGLVNQNEKAYLVYAQGEWADMKEGLIFPEYDIIESFPEHLLERCWYGIDFGYNDPLTVVRVGIVEGILYVEELFYKTEQTIDDLLLFMPSLGIKGTDTIFCDSASPGSIEQISRAGYRRAVSCVKHQGSLASGITKLKEYRMKITEDSVNLIKEIDGYVWQIDKFGKVVDGVPVDGNDHAIEAMRHAVYSKTFQPGGGKKIGPVVRTVPQAKRYK
jgi:phage terminase large subunit